MSLLALDVLSKFDPGAKEALVVFGMTALLSDARTDDCFDMSGRA